MLRQVRRVARLLGFGFLSLFAVAEFIICGSWRPLPERRRYHARWFHKYAPLSAAVVNMRIKPRGTFDGAQIIVSNHLTYLDVFVLAAQRPVIFVSMIEVKNWPWGGILARCAGALFIDRKNKRELARLDREIAETVSLGIPVVLFLEGTTTDGADVQPFYSSLLKPAAVNKWAVASCCLKYTAADTGSSKGILWYDEQPFFSHLFNLLLISRIDAVVSAGPLRKSDDRKKLAVDLREDVRRMKSEL